MRQLLTIHLRRSVLIATVVLLGAGTFAAAQSPFAPSQGPLDAILNKLNALADQIAHLQPSAPQPGPVVLTTSPIMVMNASDFVACNVVNVASTTLDVTYTLVDNLGAEFATSGASLRSGRSALLGTNVPAGFVARCRFTILTGFANNIRANMSVTSTTGTDSVVLEAR